MKRITLIMIFIVFLLAIKAEFGLIGMINQKFGSMLVAGESNTASDPSMIIPNNFNIPNIPQVFEYKINIMFLGINENQVDTSLVSQLPHWYAPHFFGGHLAHDRNFTISYHVTFLDQSNVQDYRSFLYSNAREDRAPWYIQPTYATAKYISSNIVETYFTQHLHNISLPTLLIIDTYSFDPAGYQPYYYNASYNELDATFEGNTVNSFPGGSSYQIAGGGANTRLLWLDLSAGPTGELGSELYLTSEGAVNETSVPPIWTYEGLANATEELTQDLVKYIATAVEQKFLPSYTWSPLYAYKEVKFEMLLVDLDPSDFDFLTKINGGYIIAEYQRVNPFINWTYSIANWDWESDEEFVTILNSYKNSTARTLGMDEIMATYLDSKYTTLFNASSAEQLIIPVFLFALPPGYIFEPLNWGGIAHSINNKFAYCVAKLSLSDADSEQEIISFFYNNLTIDSGSYDNFSDYLGIVNIFLEISVDVNTGSMNAYLLDDYNFQRFNQSLPFTDLLNNSLENVSPSSGTKKVKVYLNIYNLYHFIFEDAENITLNFNLTLSIYADWSRGYTSVTMHEIGHALGLLHPFNGFSYGNYDHPTAKITTYTYRLWDMTYSQMSYASDPPTISVMDIDTLQRGFIPKYWKDAVEKIQNIVELTDGRYEYFPTEVYENLLNASTHFNQSIEYYANNSDANHYYKALQAIFEMINGLDLASTTLETIIFTEDLQFLILAIAGTAVIVIVLGSVIYFLFRRRKR